MIYSNATPHNARVSPAAEPAKHPTSYDIFAGNATLKNRAIGGRVQMLVVNMSKDKHPTTIGKTTLQKRVLSGILTLRCE